MKKWVLTSIVVATLAVSGGSMANNGRGHGTPHQPASAVPATEIDVSISLTESEQADLLFMREEEKLARDVYSYLFERWGSKVFTNISRAEQQHMDSVKNILDAYGLADPALAEPGRFANADLQSLYDQLIIQGETSLVDALKVGLLIEEVDINDLYNAINGTNNPAIINVYTNLLNGSYKHLNAFTEQLTAQGVDPVPQVLTLEQVDTILSGETFSADLTNAQAVDAAGNSMQTQSRFSHSMMLGASASENDFNVTENDPVRLSSHLLPDANDTGQQAEYLIVAYHHAANGTEYRYARAGDQWVEWDGDLSTLTAAQMRVLEELNNMDIFDGTLTNLRGQFDIFVGYRLNNGKVVYSTDPISFDVN